MLAIAWQYLSGRLVATDLASREEPEWPPHPDRLFLALVAACGQSGGLKGGWEALEWLERQRPPRMVLPSQTTKGAKNPVFVPANDVEGSKIAILPEYRNKSKRFFPSMYIGDEPCMLIYPDADPGHHRPALEAICRAVTCIGHSRSLVRVWLENHPPEPTLVPDPPANTLCHLRTPYPGRLQSVEEAFREKRRPDLSIVVPYGPPVQQQGPSGDFLPMMWILRRTSGAPVTLVSTLSMTEALRGALMKAADGNPEWFQLISGHGPDGGVLDAPHLAFLPMADCGHQHADGHLLGMAGAFPRDVSEGMLVDFRFRVLPRLFETGAMAVRIYAGPLGEMTLAQEDRPVPPSVLRNETWTLADSTWATVTPMVLDRQPPRRHQDIDGWTIEQVCAACQRQGLPRPEEVLPLKVSPVQGVPAANAFPPLLRRSDGGRRWHTHVKLRFPYKVTGPLLLGAGRYRGYGMFRPLESQ